MRKFFISVVLLGLASVGCGDKKKPITVTTNAFAYMQEVPFESATFTPMLGQYLSTRDKPLFQSAMAIDASTGGPLQADFGSFYLVRDTVAFDLYGGVEVPTEQWDIYVAKTDGSGIMQITDDSYEDSYPP